MRKRDGEGEEEDRDIFPVRGSPGGAAGFISAGMYAGGPEGRIGRRRRDGSVGGAAVLRPAICGQTGYSSSVSQGDVRHHPSREGGYGRADGGSGFADLGGIAGTVSTNELHGLDLESGGGADLPG